MGQTSKAAAFTLALLCLVAGAVIGWFARGAMPAPGSFGAIAVATATPIPIVSISRMYTITRPSPRASATFAPVAAQVPSAVPLRPPEAPPEITALSISSPVVSGGQIVTGVVQTSSNVASVEARIGGYSASLTKVGVGRFALAYRVPDLPLFLHRTYQVEVIARNARGDAASSTIPVTVR
ncbi:MAG TPA: hypothetical protein VGR69_02175 [Candidatus Rubrimentiphilum sp.]|nr:hypothetical protein [Candidatus Rubrimentiphilum sp.]